MSETILAGLRPMHPGEMPREDILPALGRHRAEIARLLGVSRRILYDILDGKKPVTVDMAPRLGKLRGDGPRIWLAMRQAYDMRIAEREMAAEIEKIPTPRPA